MSSEQSVDPLAPSVMRVLLTGDSTVDEIHNLTGLPAANIRTILNTLKKRGKVEVVGKRHATNALGKPVGGPPANVWGAVS